MKKQLRYIIGILIATSIFYSCSKSFLDENLQSQYSPSNTLKDSLGFEAAIYGMQRQFRQQWVGEPQGLICCMYVGTDLAISVQPQGIETPWCLYTIGTTDAGASFYWNWAYSVINCSNFIIQGIEDTATLSRMSIKNRKMIDAEARFYRAYAYNFLSILYGDVPIIDKPVTAPKNDYVRAPVTDVINFTLNDLRFATTYLFQGDSVRKDGRISKAAARQLLAEVYIRANKPDSAEIQCNKILSVTNYYQLRTSRYGVKAGQPGDPFHDMFITGNQRRREGNKEAIWVIENQYNIAGGNPLQSPSNPIPSDQHRRVWVPRYIDATSGSVISCDSLGGRGIGRMRLSNWVIYNLYDNTDMRNSSYNLKRNWYNNNGANFGKPITTISAADTLFRLCPYTTKWNSYIPNDGNEYADYKDIIMMRLGETYLLLAEAQFKQGNLDGAAASINVIRARANATPILSTDVTLNFILDERARELLAEENRRATLVRTGTLVSRTLNLNSTYKGQGTNITSKYELLPIPQTERDLNNLTLTQNPGY